MYTLLWLLSLTCWMSNSFAQNSLSSTTSSPATPTSTSSTTATLDSATVFGISTSGVVKFLGIPYASAPTGDLRYRPPQPIPSYNQTIDATRFGYSCPQQNASLVSSFFSNLRTTGCDEQDCIDIDVKFMDVNQADDDDAPQENEDCLTVNVMRPDNATASSNLPVVVWIYGGGFETGTTYSSDDDAVRLVNRSVELGQPLVYVSMNYRVSGWGFLASQEVKDANATNLGLRDQRLALQWVNRYIQNFGGDSSRVTIWGQSAGAISVSLQMLYNNGTTDNLFRGAFMQSGSPVPVGNYTGGQVFYDQLVQNTDCSNSNDTLVCLRTVDYDRLKTAIDSTPSYFSYYSLDLVWLPRADGDFLRDSPQHLVLQGNVANIPFVNGDVDDEGTIFALSQLNVSDAEEFEQYLKDTFLSHVPSENVSDVLALYPDDRTSGSPFNTSVFNALNSQYKRNAAFQGDVVFQAPRRFFIQQRCDAQPIWSYPNHTPAVSLRAKDTPFVGAYHSSDLVEHTLDDYVVRFVTNLNPNNGTGPEWPQYNNDTKQLYRFQEEEYEVDITTDDYRVPQLVYLTELSLAYPP